MAFSAFQKDLRKLARQLERKRLSELVNNDLNRVFSQVFRDLKKPCSEITRELSKNL